MLKYVKNMLKYVKIGVVKKRLFATQLHLGTSKHVVVDNFLKMWITFLHFNHLVKPKNLTPPFRHMNVHSYLIKDLP